MHGLWHAWFEFLTCPCAKGAFSLACPEEQSFKHHKWSRLYYKVMFLLTPRNGRAAEELEKEHLR